MAPACSDIQNGNTALHCAAQYGNLGIVKLLVEAGADVRAKNQKGKTALDVAKQYKHTAIAVYLQKGKLLEREREKREAEEEMRQVMEMERLAAAYPPLLSSSESLKVERDNLKCTLMAAQESATKLGRLNDAIAALSVTRSVRGRADDTTNSNETILSLVALLDARQASLATEVVSLAHTAAAVLAVPLEAVDLTARSNAALADLTRIQNSIIDKNVLQPVCMALLMLTISGPC